MTSKKPQISIKRRFALLFFVTCLICGGLVVRLFQKSILQNNYYRALAEKQYTVQKEIPAHRGKIYVTSANDSELFPIATNMQFWDLLMIPKNIKNKKETAKKISPIINMSETEIYDLINNDKPYLPPIKKKMEKEEAQKVEDLGINGVMLVPDEYRYYPENELASHIMGFVDGSKEGRYGIEGYYNDELKGQEGVSDTSQDSLGNLISLWSQPNGKDGYDLVLTIDRVVQYITEQKLKEAIDKFQADSGQIIIMDPKTGKIIAMSSYPEFNPNDFAQQQDINIFNNPNTAVAYEPGSVMKIVSMSSAIDQNAVQPETANVFESQVQVADKIIKTSTGKAYGKETMTQVLENSDNVGMVWAVQKLGKEKLYQYFNQFGIGDKTGIDLDTEVAGNIPEFKNWWDVTFATMSFGQGLSLTPIQVLSSISSIANRGHLMQPYVVDKILDGSKTETEVKPREIHQTVSEDTADKMSQMMVSVVNSEKSQPAIVPGFQMAGKTGTAQVPDLKKGGYIEGQSNHTFVGFGPANDPKFSILVKLDNPKSSLWAEGTSAVVFGDLAKWLVSYYQLQPNQ